jgi:glucosamine--fructose-6-phosphate aminotransferase (isomerizing)
VIALATSGVVYEKMVSNMQEVRTRGGRVIAVAAENNTAMAQHADMIIPVPS